MAHYDDVGETTRKASLGHASSGAQRPTKNGMYRGAVMAHGKAWHRLRPVSEQETPDVSR